MIPLQFMGGGRMAGALISGLLGQGHVRPEDLQIVELAGTRRAELAELFPGVAVSAEPTACAGLVLATKPAAAPDALRSASTVGVQRVLSIAAGVSLDVLHDAAGDGVAVIRAMPNTPALVGSGAAAVCAREGTAQKDLQWGIGILAAVGTVEEVPEAMMDAVTGLSGSGPAYLFLVAEALIEGAVDVGLPRDIAERLTNQTLLGAATLLARGDQSAASLREMVTSPGGTTQAGLEALERRLVRTAFAESVAAATRRSSELG